MTICCKFLTLCPTVKEDQVRDYLRNLNIHTSMEPDEIHPRVLRKLADAVAKPLSMIFERSRQSGEVPGKRETLGPFLKKVERRTLGTTDMSASPLCLGRSWNRSSRSPAKAHGGQGGDSRQPAWLHQRQVLPD